jgi:hypothetical protein
VKELSLRPYFGTVRVCKSRKEYQREYKKLHGTEDDGLTNASSGRMTGRQYKDRSPVFLVWGAAPCYVAHELAHVILWVFERAGIDPREAAGEPFCYMLSQLLLEVGE